MDTQTEAQIYLSDQRGSSQLDSFQSFHSFNFGSYFDESRKPFGTLQLINDTTLKAGHSLHRRVEQHTDVIIIPLTGGLEYTSSVGNGFLEAGQAEIVSLAAGMNYQIINPYESERINFLDIWIAADTSSFTPTLRQTNFDINNTNKLVPVFTNQRSHGLIGKYGGRQEGFFQLSTQAETGVFVFVLSGVFEVQDRLLHDRDGLSLVNPKDGIIEFEALSNDAILLLIEIPLNNVHSHYA